MSEAPSYAAIEPETVIEGGELYERFHRLVISIAMEYRRQAVRLISVEDLIQEGWVGVERAYRTFRTGQGATFNTHVGNHVRWAITNAIVSITGSAGTNRRRETSFTGAGFEDPAGQFVVAPRAGVRRKEARAILHRLTKLGSRRAKLVAFLYYFRNGNQSDIGRKLGISRARVHQLLNAAFTGSAAKGNRRQFASQELERLESAA